MGELPSEPSGKVAQGKVHGMNRAQSPMNGDGDALAPGGGCDIFDHPKKKEPREVPGLSCSDQ
jgi:hypothetical protein